MTDIKLLTPDELSNRHPNMPNIINHLAAEFLHRVCGVSAKD